MNKRSAMILCVLMNRYNPQANHARMNWLTQDERNTLSQNTIQSSSLLPLFQDPKQTLSLIHHSWVQNALKQLPSWLLPNAVESLDEKKQSPSKSAQQAHTSKTVKSFLQTQIYQLLGFKEHLPIEYLPTNEFTPLLSWSKEQLVSLIDFLGLHDLASEVRHIVNRDHLKNIYACLTPKQFQYLKICLHQKDKILSPKLMIDPAHIDRAKLKHLLHKRGLSRLSKALSGQNPDFIWHLVHRLDTGRGNLLLKDYQKEALPKMTLILKQQTVHLMSFLKSEP